MQLNINRFFSDRIVFDNSREDKLRVTNTFWDWCQRIISWVWSITSYTDENRRTVSCFRKYLIDALGPERLQRISSRYQINFEQMEKKGSPLLSRDVAKIVVGAANVTVDDINEYIQKSPSDPLVKGKKNFLDLDSNTLASIHKKLNNPFKQLGELPPIEGEISGKPTETLACIFYDPFLADRERLELVKEHPTDPFETFMHNMVARVIKRDMDVGTLVPAPNHSSGRAQFYYVSAKLVTGHGMISYLFHPASPDTDLEPIRLFRGTSTRNSELDSLSTMITDLEKDLGRSAYKSGEIYEKVIREKLPIPAVEGGHSLGSTVVQYRLANMDHIRKAYLYCGPGIPMSEVEKFNQKVLKPKLIIRATEGDRWHKMGEAHLGHKMGSMEHIDVRRYRPLKKDGAYDRHVTVWPKEKYEHEVITHFPSESIDKEFHNQYCSAERARSSVGPILASILSIARFLSRNLVTGRIHLEKGLKLGTIQNGRWKVHHYRAHRAI